MQNLFSTYFDLFTNRCEHIPLLEIGEDSVRYDFFMALTEVNGLKNHEIVLESAIDKRSFIPRDNKKSNRKENPKMDLVVDKLNLCVEFGLFRQNSNEEGTINKTSRLVKMLNDMIRLGLESYHTKRRAYFICVADSKMLGHQLNSKILESFPANYIINKELVDKLCEKKTSNFDRRFINKMNVLNLSFNSRLIYDKEVIASKIYFETRILIWEVC